MSSIAAAMIQHNVWANLRLVGFLATLDPARLNERSAGTYGDILSTMIHIGAAERGYLSALSGAEAEGPRSDQTYALPQLRDWLDKNGAPLSSRSLPRPCPVRRSAAIDGGRCIRFGWKPSSPRSPTTAPTIAPRSSAR